MRISQPIAEAEALDLPAERLDRFAQAVVGDDESSRAARWRGEALGHPLHPLLTDLPIGFWTSALALDVLGGRRCRSAARRLTGLGVLAAAPTMVAGLAEFRTVEDAAARRVAVAHAATNLTTSALYAGSWWARRRRPIAGAAIGLMAAAIATAGGMLGGDLAFPASSTGGDDEEAGDRAADYPWFVTVPRLRRTRPRTAEQRGPEVRIGIERSGSLTSRARPQLPLPGSTR